MVAESRSVVVRLSLETAKYIADAKTAGKATEDAFDGIDGKVDATNSRMIELETSTRGVGAGARDTAGDLQKMDRELDSVTGRVRLLAEAGLVLGPALVPIGAVGVAGLVALTSAAGFAAGGAGALVLGFQGVGDTLSAVNEAALDPTAAKLAAARLEMSRLSPEAQSLVGTLSGLRDEGNRLQETAAAGVLPGVEDAIVSLSDRLPAANRLVRTFSEATGDLFRDAGASLAGDRYRDFFQFLNQDARANIDGIGDSVGNLALAGTELFEAFSPLQRDGLDALVAGTERLDKAASGLEDSEGFANFSDYIRETGPQVLDTLGAIANAGVQIVQATAPLAGPVLQGLEVAADVVGDLADSDLGTPFFGALAGILAYQRALKVTQGLQARVTGSAASESAPASGGLIAGARNTASSAGTGLKTVGSDLANVARFGSLASESTERLKGQLGGIAKAGAGVAALTVLTTDAADGFGLNNTAALGLAGTIAGPYGAAIGAAVGLVIDLAGANRDLADAIDAANASSADDGVASLYDDREAVSTQLDELNEKQRNFFTDFNVGNNLDAVVGGLRDQNGQAEESLDSLKSEIDSTERALIQLGVAVNGVDIGKAADGASLLSVPLGELQSIADRAAPAMDALGISVEDLANASPGELDRFIAQIATYQSSADSASGRTETLVGAVDGLDDVLASTADSASAFTAALDGVLSPGLNLSGALDAYRAGLRNLNDELAENGRSLTNQTNAADENRAAVRRQVTNITSLLTAQAESGASSEQLSRNLRRQRDALLEAGSAAGLSGQELSAYLRRLGLTPRLVRTLVEANTDKADSNIRTTKRGLGDIDGTNARARIDVDNGGATSAIQQTISDLARVDGTTVTTFIDTVRRNAPSAQAGNAIANQLERADGGFITGPGGPRDDLVPVMASNGEYIVNAAATARNIDLLEAINSGRFMTDMSAGALDRAQGYANGGRVRPSGAQPTNLFAGRPTDRDIRGLKREESAAEKALRRLERQVDAATTAFSASEEVVSREASAREDLVGQFNDLTNQIAGMFRSDVFADPGNRDVWRSTTSGPDPISVLMADIAQSDEFASLFAGLQGRGLGGAALQTGAQGGVAGLSVLAGYDDARLQQFEDLVGVRDQRTTATGQAVAQAQFGQALVAADQRAATAEAQRDQANTALFAILAAQQAGAAEVRAATQDVAEATRLQAKKTQSGQRSRPRSGGRR